MLTTSACAQSEGPSSSESVGRNLEVFFRAYLSRSLTRDETRGVTDEYLRLFGSTVCETPCLEDLANHLRIAHAAFDDGPDTPNARLWRQSYVTRAAFAEPPTGPTWMRLLQEPDPIALAHPVTERTMTQADIEALADLSRFVDEGGAPDHHPLDADEFERFKAEVSKLVGPQSRRMPIKATLAAELFAGLQTEWDRLSEAERTLMRDYLGGVPVSVPEDLFARVLHISVEDARQLQSAEALDTQLSGFYANLDQMRRGIYGALGEYATLSALMAATP
ncbi:MAG TPA: hypothetical protein PK417_02515 [Hyphomonas sp.]|nr:hypothetical protein [Hyphomonas sp.]HRX72653.1 hypothetical protein [Hyphomonas sp.]